MKRTRVNWQFNRKFRIQRTFPSQTLAQEYVHRVKRLWNIDARLTVLS